ncbi:cation:proton antiporter [Paenibacillus frigoriresistens]|uniref:cation:proton antiporter domain-containing protein n=1 Tax=Paenibacillus alginolyticus TaxID=59839 RepID=UPI001565B33C|nr:cation:proton antiporter [Paenibacillus frigoriresistens]NRF94457.1 cation:proton antiporter [Paenibacillus frigoriresistens]
MIHYWLALLTIAVAVAYIADKMKQPYPTLLVIAGLLLGVIPIHALDEIKTYVASDHVFQTAVILIFLSALIGDAALKLHVQELKANKRPILLLSLLGTFITFVLVAGLCNALLGLSLQKSLVFGALMAATDPVSVLSIFKARSKQVELLVKIRNAEGNQIRSFAFTCDNLDAASPGIDDIKVTGDIRFGYRFLQQVSLFFLANGSVSNPQIPTNFLHMFGQKR